MGIKIARGYLTKAGLYSPEWQEFHNKNDIVTEGDFNDVRISNHSVQDIIHMEVLG